MCVLLYLLYCTVLWLAGLQLPQPQPCAERVARVGAVPDCRQAHYLSLAKGEKKGEKEAHYTKDTLTEKEHLSAA